MSSNCVCYKKMIKIWDVGRDFGLPLKTMIASSDRSVKKRGAKTHDSI